MKETSESLLLNVIFIRMQRPELEKENAVTFSQIWFWGGSGVPVCCMGLGVAPWSM
jgi:hypothetical protein